MRFEKQTKTLSANNKDIKKLYPYVYIHNLKRRGNFSRSHTSVKGEAKLHKAKIDDRERKKSLKNGDESSDILSKFKIVEVELKKLFSSSSYFLSNEWRENNTAQTHSIGIQQRRQFFSITKSEHQ